MKRYRVAIQYDFEGNNIEICQMQVTMIERRSYGFHGFVYWEGLSQGVYSTDGENWCLDIWAG